MWSEEFCGMEKEAWIFKHELAELCGAVKGPALKQLLEREDTEKVFYFDPNIAVFNSLQPLVNQLDHFSILLTPHQVQPNEFGATALDSATRLLSQGTYNLGFIGVRNDYEGRKFADWWAGCLRQRCYDDPPKGLFVDQKWCDVVPAFFGGVGVLRDPGYNVASWNLGQRRISFGADGALFANNSPLRFFHFPKTPLEYALTHHYAKSNVEVYELWSWHERQLERYHEPAIPHGWWKFGEYANGETIARAARVLYRNREDLQRRFPNPFATDEEENFYRWFSKERQSVLD
jgi:hypothetical protein